MTAEAGDFHGRRAPYAPISALEKFFERIRDRATPDRVDHKFLRKLNVAHNNEYSLLSALKFLGVVDDLGTPTTSYRSLQSTDGFNDTLWRLVQLAYKPVFDAGAESWNLEDLVNFFRVSSSPSQAKNAARFFRAVCVLSGHQPWQEIEAPPPLPAASERHAAEVEPEPETGRGAPSRPQTDVRSVPARPATEPDLLLARAALLEKLPALQPQWTLEQYQRICDTFLEMLRHLGAAE